MIPRNYLYKQFRGKTFRNISKPTFWHQTKYRHNVQNQQNISLYVNSYNKWQWDADANLYFPLLRTSIVVENAAAGNSYFYRASCICVSISRQFKNIIYHSCKDMFKTRVYFFTSLRRFAIDPIKT